MKSEIKIILDPSFSPPEKGKVFESIVRDILETQRFNISPNVNFTGMEIDLIASHMDRNEESYVECKAKERLTSTDIHTFTNKVFHKKMQFGFFLSTTEFQHDVAGLVDEFSRDERYKNLYFWQPQKCIELLVDSKRIHSLDLSKIKFKITKKILTLTYFGEYYILIIKDSVVPKNFTIIKANEESVINDDNIELLRKNIPEISDLSYVKSNYQNSTNKINDNSQHEVIAEIQESENWFDYLPASTKHFIGRKELRNNIFNFFSQVKAKDTNRRVFYLDGKSGWGKSSLVAEIRGRSRNTYNRNKYFILALDSRSALSSNFIALAFTKLIIKAIENKFIKEDLFTREVEITSNYDVLSSESVRSLFKTLEEQKKVLVIIFDQFEDVFRKKDIFQSFYKFLLDVKEFKSNLIVGFSWKSEINIPMDHEAYHLWQQAKEYATEFSIPEFGPIEINGVIKQLEKTINRKLDLELRRRLIESSQGFPWLIKKLCIHTYKQIKSGKSEEDLIEQELNIEQLFKNDLEGLSSKEIDSLNYIAKRSYDDNTIDISEIDDIDEEILNSLVNKRLVIKSGTKYNVYWDIFRDYLVTNEVPIIGESYILRQNGSTCLKVFKLFKDKKPLTIEDLLSLLPKRIKATTLDNILRDLKSIGLIKQSEINGNYHYSVKNKDILITYDGFKGYITQKFTKYTPYIKLNKSDKKLIDSPFITIVLKDTFRGSNFTDQTWGQYTQILVNWFKLSDLPIVNKLSRATKKRLNKHPIKRITTPKDDVMKKYKHHQWPYNSPQQNIKALKEISKKYHDINNTSLNDIFRKKIYDLKLLGIVTGSPFSRNADYKFTDVGTEISNIKDLSLLKKELSKLAIKIPKLKRAVNIYYKKPEITYDDLYTLDKDLFKEYLTESSRHYKVKMVYRWVKFIYENLGKEFYSLQ